MPQAADPRYDLLAALEQVPGLLAQREMLDAVGIYYAAHGFRPLSLVEVENALQTAPPEGAPQGVAPTVQISFPVTAPPPVLLIKRFSDSNPASDGWAIDSDGFGGGAGPWQS